MHLVPRLSCRKDLRAGFVLYLPFGGKAFKKSSETQGQIVGARESLNARKNMARRKVKNGEKSPRRQYLTTPVLNGLRLSGFWLGRKTQKFSGTNQKLERRRPFRTGVVRHCSQGLFSPFFTFLRAIFFGPFRLSLAPTICPWVSEDGGKETQNRSTKWTSKVTLFISSKMLRVCKRCSVLE